MSSVVAILMVLAGSYAAAFMGRPVVAFILVVTGGLWFISQHPPDAEWEKDMDEANRDVQ